MNYIIQLYYNCNNYNNILLFIYNFKMIINVIQLE